ncbi:MAG TPA: undecaprenyl-diphosphate phosphatase, partial [Castellaniella sp.]|nr:undecaprenyl-diphosphate phosphatase [Castellaniella sp.]
MTDSFWFLLQALFLGLIEGFTEFIPVSSTAHLLLVGDWIGFPSDQNKVFEVVIQLGSILAVMWLFRARLLRLVRGYFSGDPQERGFVHSLLLAFLPAAIVGA